MLHRFVIACVGVALLFGCDAGPRAAAPSATALPAPDAPIATPMLRSPQPPMAMPVRITATPTPDFMGIPERVATTPFPTISLPAQPTTDFAFSFGYGACGITRVLSAFDNTLMQRSLNTPAITVTLTLTDDDRTAIYQQMTAINLFSYPPTYQIPLPDDQLRIITAPHPRYEFTLRSGTILKSVAWDDAIGRPTSLEADQLRSLIALLKAIIDGHPEVAQLPPLVEACA